MNPLVVRHALWPMHERLLGRPTLKLLSELESSQWLSRDELHTLQTTRLRRLLAHAYRTSPFYRDRLRGSAIDPTTCQLSDLSRLPLLSKDDIRLHQEKMIDPTQLRALTRMTTGGSTGAPLAFHVDRLRQAADQAARARSRRWFGIEIGQRELYLWGSPIETTAQDRLKGLRDRLTNQRLLSAFDMTPTKMSRHLDEMQRFDPVHLFGYPSSIARLVRFARETGQPFSTPSLRAVFVTGEVLDPADRATVEDAVNCPLADGYGAREAGFIAHQCPHGSYHVTMESLIVEIVDPSGQCVAPGEGGEVVITHLDAMAMPFIRYRTGDLARFEPQPCPCGRGLEILADIRGRKADRIRTADGESHALSLIYVLREHTDVREFKIIQRPDLSLDVLIVSERENLDTGDLGRRLSGRVGANIDVRISLVEAIPPDPSGKHRCVVSHA